MMKPFSGISNLFKSGKPFGQITKEQTSFIKGIAILAIIFHNYFHWVAPSTGENEFDFSLSRIISFGSQFINNPLEIINLFFSYFGHFGVQLFIFASGYGLVKATKNGTGSLTSFLGKRMSKLYPAFLLAILVLFLLIFYRTSSVPGAGWIGGISYKILMVANIIPNQLFGINGPWWFYSLIFQLYLVFPLLKRIYERFKGWGFIILSAVAYLLIIFCNPFFSKYGANLMGTFIGHLPEFLLGMYFAFRPDVIIKRWTYICALIIFILSNIYSWAWPFTFVSISFLTIGLIKKSFVKIQWDKNFTRFILYIGNISMYLFAVHGFLRDPFVKSANSIHNFFTTILLGIGFFLVSLMLAYGIKELELNIRKLNNLNSFQKIKTKFFSLPKIQKSKSLRNDWGRHFIVFFVFSTILRIVEYIIGYHTGSIGETSFQSFLTHFWSYDFMAWITIGTAFFLIYGIIYFFSKQAANILAKISVYVYSILSILLIIYFQYAKLPLDHIIFNYNFNDTIFIINSTKFPQVSDILLIIFGISALYLFYRYFHPRHINMLVNAVLGVGLLCWIFQVPILVKPTAFKTEYEYYCNVNKANLFIDRCFNYLANDKKEVSESDMIPTIKRFQKLYPEKHFAGQLYPLWNNNDFENVLGPYFELKDEKPNIVFLIVESLSGRSAGPEATLKGFTPFLDSLAYNGLYWPNTLAISQRTFGVLPSALGSLPFGVRGFTSAIATMPRHLSLLSELKNNGYFITFNYGGKPEFDNMKHFLVQNNVDFILQNSANVSNPNTVSNEMATNEYNKWGYRDKILFEKAMDTLKHFGNKTPRLDIFLTLSTHDPFDIPNMENYMKKADIILSQANNEIKESIKKSGKEYLSTLVYTDEQIRNLFSMYKQLPEYENTIFIIVGDHSSENLPAQSMLSKYHVPLIIYSPLLKNTASFKAVNSHFDILPSLLSLLKCNFDVQLTPGNAWMGNGLDTSSIFINKHSLAFMLNNRDVLEYLSKDLFFYKNTLFKLKENFALEEIKNVDQQALDNMQQQLDDYIAVNQYVWLKDKIIPHYIVDEAFSKRLLFIHQYNFDEENPTERYVNRLSTFEAYSGTRSIYMAPDNEYSFVINTTQIPNKGRLLSLEISAKIFLVNNNKDSLPQITVSIKNHAAGEHLIYSSDKLFNMSDKTLPKNQWIDYNYTREFDIYDISRQDSLELSIYLWNNKKSAMYYDDITVSVFFKEAN